MKPKKVFKNLVALMLIILLFSMVKFSDLLGALSYLTPFAVTVLLVISVVLVYVSVLKWNLFLEALSARASVVRLFNLYLVGYFVNLLVPSYVGGDVVRSYYIGKKVGQHEAFTATLLERYTGIVAMLALSLGCMWFSELATLQIKAAVAVVAAVLGLITALALSPVTLGRINRIGPLRNLVTHLEKIQKGLHLVRQDKFLLAKALALSFLYHSITVINTVVAAHAVGWGDAPGAELFVILPLILLVGCIPIAPSGLGIQEGAFFYFLQGIGATPAQALGVGLVLRAKSYLVALLGGVLWLILKRRLELPVVSSDSPRP